MVTVSDRYYITSALAIPGNRARRRPFRAPLKLNGPLAEFARIFSGCVSKASRSEALEIRRFGSFRGAANPGCSRLGLRSPLDFGHSCGRQSCLQAAFQAAVSDTRRISQASLRDACETRSRRNACELRKCLFEEPPERRLQAGLPAPLSFSTNCHEMNVQTPGRPGKAACRHDCLPHERP